MAKGNSADKVARAAKAGASGATSENRRLGFRIAMACVVILGVLLIGWSRSNREATSAPRVGDHWHSAYDIYVCAELIYICRVCCIAVSKVDIGH